MSTVSTASVVGGIADRGPVRYHQAMRVVLASLVALGIAACGGAQKSAWPKSAGTERLGEPKDDGGESLEPRVPSEVAAVEAGGAPEPVVIKPEIKASAVTPGKAPDAVTPPPVVDGTPQIIELTEEIIITDDP